MELRSAYNYDRNKASKDAGLEFKDKSRARQSDKEQADINFIVKQFGVTGRMPQNIKPVMYGDFSEVFDFQSAQQAIIDAQRSFGQLSAEIRDRFGNDPQKFMDFCTAQNADGKLENLAEMRKWKLALPEEEPPPEVIQKVQVVGNTPTA